ncbi:MAG: RNA-directed DNA polymerase [archaeon]
MPLGNMTSQFFANVYLNDLDHFIKCRLKAKYYLRYVDDFLILHQDKKVLEEWKDKITKYLMNLRLELHKDKTKIYPFYNGVDLLGFKVFYFYKIVRKRNLRLFYSRLKQLEEMYKEGQISKKDLMEKLRGWFAYVVWGNTYGLRRKLIKDISKKFNLNSEENIKNLNKIAKISKNIQRG